MASASSSPARSEARYIEQRHVDLAIPLGVERVVLLAVEQAIESAAAVLRSKSMRYSQRLARAGQTRFRIVRDRR